MNRGTSLIAIAGLLCPSAVTLAAEQMLPRAAVSLERNITDRDSEIKFDVTGADEGLAALRVTAPDGRIVVDFKVPDTKLGLHHISLELPEPKDDGRLQADFPAGTYRFVGTTVSGATLQRTATRDPPLLLASLTYPRAEQKGIPLAGVQIKWQPLPNLASVIVVIQQEETGGAKASRQSSRFGQDFAVPEGNSRWGDRL